MKRTRLLWRQMVLLSVMLACLSLAFLSLWAKPVYAGDGLEKPGPGLSASYGGDPLELNITRDESSSNGQMYLFSSDKYPWQTVRNSVVMIIIGNGVESIETLAFADMPKLTTVYLPNSMKYIGEKAFSNCPSLKNVYYFGTETQYYSNLYPNIKSSGNEAFISKIICCDKGGITFSLRTADGKSQDLKWAGRYIELLNSFYLKEAAGTLGWQNKGGHPGRIDLDLDGKNDLDVAFVATDSSSISASMKSGFLGTTKTFDIPGNPSQAWCLEGDCSYYDQITFIFPDPFHGDRGKYTIDLTSGKAVITDAKEQDYLSDLLYGAYFYDLSIKKTYDSYPVRRLDIDMDGKEDLQLEYSTSDTTITKLDTCSLKDDTTIALSAAACSKFDSDEFYYYSILELKIKEELKLAPDGTAVGKGASEAAADAAITAYSDEKDMNGSVFAPLRASSTKQTNNSITLSWKKVSGAKKYIIYGNLCGSKYKMIKLGEVTKKKYTVKKINKKLKKGKYYKFIIVAVDGSGTVLSTSKTVHASTSGGKYGNYSSVKTKADTSEYENELDLFAGEKFKLRGKGVTKSSQIKVKKHRAFSYESSDPSIAKVSKKGVITAVKEGECYIYAYAQNGVYDQIEVEVD